MAEAGGTQVLVAANDLQVGTQLTPQLVQAVAWPRQSVPAGAFSDSAQVLQKEKGCPELPGGACPARVVMVSIQKGEPVLESKLAPVGTTGGLSSIIPVGRRAMTVSVNEIIGVAGFALPGSFVDILVNTQDDKAPDRSKQISKIVLQRVKVLAVAQESARDPNKPKVVSAVTLEVTPEEAEKIDLARSVGTLTLVLRNQVDSTAVDTEGARKPMLLSESSAAQAEPAPTPQPAVAAAPAEPAKPAPKPAPTKKKAAPKKKPAGEAGVGSEQDVEVIRGVKSVTERVDVER